MKTLHLPLRKKWYEMIDSGVKPEDYRENKPYWCKRLYKNGDMTTQELKPYTHVMFSYGYTKRRMTFEINKIILSFGKTEWGAPSDKEVFIIKLGMRERKVGEIFDYKGNTFEVVENNNCIGCYFRYCIGLPNNARIVTGYCSPNLRKDGKSVIFKEVKK